LSDCVVRIETGLWVIRLHYVVKAYVRNVVNYLTTVDYATTVHGRGLPWALAVHSSQSEFID